MAVTGPRRIKAVQRRALEMFADAGLNGCTDSALLAHGFKIELLIRLARDGFTTTAFERVTEGRLTVDVARTKITDAGRRAIEG
jgi:hypothetical protein